MVAHERSTLPNLGGGRSFQFQLACRNPSSARNVSPTRRTAVMQTRAGALRNAPATVRRLTMMNAICRALLLYPMQVE